MTPLAKLGPGDPMPELRETWNALMDAGRAGRRALFAPGVNAPTYPDTQWTAQTTIFVVSVLDTALDAFSVLELADPLVDPVTAPHTVRQTPVFEGGAPTDYRKPFAITLEPVAAGGIARAAILGVVPCKINVTDTAHEYAIPSAGVTAALTSARAGPARILWAAPGTGPHGTGTVAAVVLLTSGDDPAVPDPEGDCTGRGWLAGLSTDSCLAVSVESESGACACGDTSDAPVYLKTSDGNTYTASGGGGDLTTACCPGDPTPGTLHGTCTDGRTVTLTQSGGAWAGVDSSGYTISMGCVSTTWFLTDSFFGGSASGSGLVCNPFSVTFVFASTWTVTA